MNRHTMRKLYGISAAMLILAASLAGCGSNSSAEKAPAAPLESAAETSAQSGGQARELSEETAASEAEVKEEEAKEEETKEQETAAEDGDGSGDGSGDGGEGGDGGDDGGDDTGGDGGDDSGDDEEG